MSEGDACPVPMQTSEDEEAIIRRMLKGRRIAVVGLSDDPGRPSYGVSQYLQGRGFTILPVNPNCTEVLGERCYPSLSDVPGPIDVVDVFQRPLACADVVRQAIEVGTRGVWLQSGIRNEEAARLAREAGIDFVQDRCLMVEHMRHR